MEVISACPFVVSTLLWEPAPGKRSLTVCVKATFSLVHGEEASIAELQEPITADLHWDGDPRAGLLAAGDLAPFKPRADILFSGHAYAPGGAPADNVIARLQVGGFRKALSVTGDRAWVPSFDGVRASVAVPFRRMPLRYDRAVRSGENVGGIDVTTNRHEAGRALANIAAIGEHGGETPGLGPLPMLWRARRIGVSDAALLWASTLGLRPAPTPPGFDFRLFNAAPLEQQVEDLPPGVSITLENLSPDRQRLETRLPATRVRLFRAPPRSQRSVEVPVRCDTLWINGDRGICCALWRGTAAIDGPDEESVGTLVITAEIEGERVGSHDVDRMLRLLLPEVQHVTREDLAAPPSAPPPAPEEPDAEDHPTPAPVAPPKRPKSSTTMVPPASESSSAVFVLPFKAAALGFDLDQPLPTEVEPTYEAPEENDDGERTPPRGFALPESTSTEVRLVAPLEGREGSQHDAEPPPPPAFVVGPRPRGRSKTVKMELDTEVTMPALSLQALRAASAARDGNAAPRSPPPPPLVIRGLDEAREDALLPVALYCAVKMEAWEGRAPLREILAQRGLDEIAWHRSEERQAEALDREASAGSSELALALMDGFEALRTGGGRTGGG